MNPLACIVKKIAYRTGRLRSLYIRLCKPSGYDYADFLRHRKLLHAIGQNCSILPSTLFTDPHLVSLGNNVHFSSCALICHDGSVAMLDRAYHTTLESLGPIHIKDNCFIGFSAIILPNVTIGPNSIVAAGAVVTKDVPPNTIVAGIPAKPIGTTDALVQKLQQNTHALPWSAMLEQYAHTSNPALLSQLHTARLAHFFPNSPS